MTYGSIMSSDKQYSILDYLYTCIRRLCETTCWTKYYNYYRLVAIHNQGHWNNAECVQRRFTKNLRAYSGHSYLEKLRRLELQSLEHRRLLLDLIFCYKIVFGIVDVPMDDFFSFSTCTLTRGHKFKLYKKLIRRWDSERELSLRRQRARDTKYNRLLHKFRHRSTRRLCVGTHVFTKFSEITQCNGHYAVQGHSRSPILVPIKSSYTTSY